MLRISSGLRTGSVSVRNPIEAIAGGECGAVLYCFVESRETERNCIACVSSVQEWEAGPLATSFARTYVSGFICSVLPGGARPG